MYDSVTRIDFGWFPAPGVTASVLQILFACHPNVLTGDHPIKQETGEAITDAAERLLTRSDYGKMTMSDLAQGALRQKQEIQIVADLLTEGAKRGTFDVEDIPHTADAMLWETGAFLPRNLRQQDLEAPHLVPKRTRQIVNLLLRAVVRQDLIP